ncbi:LOW QUALITY PROTEIN: hypothetical protein PHMEG_00029371 [Phytophthora megakarya]|uniref:Uncharacterized protein n=1 Tax=Phytophthora megakarya TaxID=4795 RepID=A0A225V290_9STRA|nr:LOW QUALITY PROTEIN: hypothetical protein PHMEG_00029371 [Phytophthora megakarya]
MADSVAIQVQVAAARWLSKRRRGQTYSTMGEQHFPRQCYKDEKLCGKYGAPHWFSGSNDYPAAKSSRYVEGEALTHHLLGDPVCGRSNSSDLVESSPEGAVIPGPVWDSVYQLAPADVGHWLDHNLHESVSALEGATS